MIEIINDLKALLRFRPSVSIFSNILSLENKEAKKGQRFQNGLRHQDLKDAYIWNKLHHRILDRICKHPVPRIGHDNSAENRWECNSFHQSCQRTLCNRLELDATSESSVNTRSIFITFSLLLSVSTRWSLTDNC